MKIGIITICDDGNLGNRLQNYAVQKTLEGVRSNISAETLKNTSKIGSMRRAITCIKRAILKIRYTKRSTNFMEFNKAIKMSSKTYDYRRNNRRLAELYDYFLVGSDQVWNPNYGWLTPIDLLEFARPEQRIAFSASFGVDRIPSNRKKEVAEQLMKFKRISVREDRGKEIVEELTGRKDIEVLVDPTMLLGAEEWGRVAKRPDGVDDGEKFILVYFLGGLAPEKRHAIEKISKKMDWKIIDIFDKTSKYFSCGPKEFLWLEKNAELICTDSFHSSVFAIINERPFVAFDRGGNDAKMNSRLDTLIAKFRLKNRWFNGEEITPENMNIDYSGTKIILSEERRKSHNFIKKALDIDEN